MITPAYIDISVICSKCGAELYSGVYKSGIIGKLKKKIKDNGWIHNKEWGTLCPDCQQQIIKGV